MAPAPPADADDDPSFDGWVPVRRLGAGAMGEVWEVRRGPVRGALKRPLNPDNPEQFERFRREAGAALALGDHPGLVGIKAIGTDPAQPYVVFELIEGEDLEARLARGGPPSHDQALAWLVEIASALDALHAAGCVHRDLKTSNLLLDAAGRTRIADLGLVRYAEGAALTESGAVIGTPYAMAPEQVEGKRAGPPADIYALGVLAFELMTGLRPFTGETSFALMSSILHGRRRRVTEGVKLPAGVDPGALEAVFDRSFARDPEDRPSSAAALVEELGTALAGASPRSSTPWTRRPVLALVVALGLAAGLLVFGLGRHRERAYQAKVRDLAKRIHAVPRTRSWSADKAMELAVYRAADLTFPVPPTSLDHDRAVRSRAAEVAALVKEARGLPEPDRGRALADLEELRLKVAPDEAGGIGGAPSLDPGFQAGLEALRGGSAETAREAFKSGHGRAARLGLHLAEIADRPPTRAQLKQLEDLRVEVLRPERLADAVLARAVTTTLFDPRTTPELRARLHDLLATRADDELARRLYHERLDRLFGEDPAAFVTHRLRVESGSHFQALIRLPKAMALQLALAAIAEGRARVKAWLEQDRVKAKQANGVKPAELDPPEELLNEVRSLHARAWQVLVDHRDLEPAERRRIARALPQWFVDMLALTQVDRDGHTDRSDTARLRFQLKLAPLDRRTTTLLPRQEENLHARGAYDRLEREQGRTIWLRLVRGLACGLILDIHGQPAAERRRRVKAALSGLTRAIEHLTAAIDSGLLGPTLLCLARQERVQRHITRLQYRTLLGEWRERISALRAGFAELAPQLLAELAKAKGGPCPWLAPFCRLQLLEQRSDAGGDRAVAAIRELIELVEACPEAYPDGDESVLRDVLFPEERGRLLLTEGKRREYLGSAHAALSRVHEACARPEAALAEAEAALKIDPLSAMLADHAVRLAIRLKRLDEARRLLGLFVIRDPTKPHLDGAENKRTRDALAEAIRSAESR